MILRTPVLSLLIRPRSILLGAVLAVVTLALMLLALRVGSYPLDTSEIVAALLGRASDMDQLIVNQNRLPRILTAIGAGAAFGLAGALLQALLRNPLASPDVIGFNAGAAFGALGATVLTGGGVLAGALIGGLSTAALVMVLAWKNGLNPYRLILVGIGVSLTLSAGADLLMSRIDTMTAADMAKWLVGTLNTRDWGDVRTIWLGLLICVPVALWLSFALERLSMADDIALGLGLALTPLRVAIIVTSVATVALAVGVAGPLPFVAFVAGPIARQCFGRARPALMAAALIGACITLTADLAARSVPMVQLPAGVFTAFIGAPVLMVLLLAHFRKGPW